MRARYPDVEGFIERDGVKIGYEAFGEGAPAVVFSPIDGIVHSRAWKAQVPYLARRSKVVTIDPRGNGRSDRPQSSGAYADSEFVDDTIAVMDATGIEQAVLVGMCTSAWRALLTAVRHPGRVRGVVAIASWAPFLTPPIPERVVYDFDQALDTDEGWAKQNRHYWLRDWRGFAEFFFGELLPEPHSTKQHEDCVSWAMEIGAETMLIHDDGPVSSSSRDETEAILARVRCPVLAIHGRADRFDLWVGDEAWDVDYFLHENPELKRAPYAWLTDFVGWLPMPGGGAGEQALTADYNAEMIEQIARFPGCGTGPCSSGTPVTWCRTPSVTGFRRSATGSGRITSSRATSRDSSRRTSPTATASAPSLATGPARRCAWSRSAALAWARA